MPIFALSGIVQFMIFNHCGMVNGNKDGMGT
ncbi:hypothetical protein H337_07030 [Vibrio parahaemolyticus EN9701121]|nr:hypothetical protein H337_07030 [Vibrio parahaemolyticus EN9701121]